VTPTIWDLATVLACSWLSVGLMLAVIGYIAWVTAEPRAPQPRRRRHPYVFDESGRLVGREDDPEGHPAESHVRPV